MTQQEDHRRADHDSPWKMALEAYFEEFLELLFPAMNVHVDWSKGYSFLDNELHYSRLPPMRTVADAMPTSLLRSTLKTVAKPGCSFTWRCRVSRKTILPSACILISIGCGIVTGWMW